MAAMFLTGTAGTALAGELTPLNQTFPSVGFESIGQASGVKVFKDENAPAIRIGAEGRLAARPDQIIDELLDYDHQVGKVARLSQSRILERAERRLLVYQRLNLPIIDDRDFNLVVTWGEQDGAHWVRWRAVREGVPPQPGVVRVTDHEGSWQIEQLGSSPVSRARFQVRLDVAGLVPRWMVRSGAGKEMPDFFNSIRGMLVERMLLGGKPCTSKSC
jgi:hypothetical protein